MTIEYKTEGRLELNSDNKLTDSAVVTWVKGDDKVLLLQGGSGRVTLSKSQLIRFAKVAGVIADDLQPRMTSLQG